MKPPRTSRTSTSNTKNIRREIIQIIFLDLKGHWNQAQKPLETSTKPQIGEALRIQAFKAPKNFHHKPSNTNNIRSRIIQTTYLDLKVHWNQAQKLSETSTNYKSVKLYGFKPLKPRRTSTINLRRRRTRKTKNKEFLTSS